MVDEFLRDELNYIVVKSWDAADEGMRLLRTDVDGRATFLVHPEDSQAKFSFLLDESGRRAAAHRTDTPAQELHSRAQRLRQIAGSNSAEAGQRLYRSRCRHRPHIRAGKSRTRSFFRSPASVFTT